MLTIHHPVALIGYACLGVLGLALAQLILSAEHFVVLAQFLAYVLLGCTGFCLGRSRTLREQAELKAEEKEHLAARARLDLLWRDPRTRLDAIIVFFRETEHLIPRVASVLALPKLSDVVAKVEAHAAQAKVLGLDREAVAQLMRAVDVEDQRDAR